VIAISDDFPRAIREGFGIAGDNIHVIENWAPLDEITPRARDNAWAQAQGLVGREVVLYTGTLGMKHDPAQLLALARALQKRKDATLVVTSEGPAAEWLTREGAALPTLRVLPFQPYAFYPEVLASADVLLSVLEADAGIYSVPSKVLSYLCAGRAIVLSAPADNLAVRLVRSSGAGRATTPGRHDELVAAVFGLLDDTELSSRCASQARAYAERTFDVATIANRFEHIFHNAMMPKLAPLPVLEGTPAG
jgi:colanic acid biosynthesis glycosyl transferase WcaI